MLDKGIQTTGYPNTENKSLVRAINTVITNDYKAKRNEHSYTQIIQDSIDKEAIYLGSIVYGTKAIIFEQTDDYFIVYDYDINNDVRDVIFKIADIAYINSSILTGELNYNRYNERIITWTGGRLADNCTINERNLCIVNIDVLPFTLDSNKIVQNIYGNDYTLIFQNPVINIPTVLSFNVDKTGGSLKGGVYHIAIQYKYNDRDYTNALNFIQPITIVAANKNNSFESIDGSNIGEYTSKAISLRFKDIDKRFNHLRFIIYFRDTTTRAFHTSDILINKDLTEHQFIISGVDFKEISLDAATIDSLYINKADTLSSFEDRLLIGSVKYNEEVNFQKWAIGFKVTPISEQFISYDGIKGSFKDETTIFWFKSFMPNEVYAFDVTGIYHNGQETRAFHIPGRELTTDEKLIVSSQYEIPNAKKFQVLDTSWVDPTTHKLNMGGWENEDEYYPNTDDFINTELNIDLRKKNVRHHKIPSIESFNYEASLNGRDPNKVNNYFYDVEEILGITTPNGRLQLKGRYINDISDIDNNNYTIYAIDQPSAADENIRMALMGSFNYINTTSGDVNSYIDILNHIYIKENTLDINDYWYYAAHFLNEQSATNTYIKDNDGHTTLTSLLHRTSDPIIAKRDLVIKLKGLHIGTSESSGTYTGLPLVSVFTDKSHDECTQCNDSGDSDDCEVDNSIEIYNCEGKDATLDTYKHGCCRCDDSGNCLMATHSIINVYKIPLGITVNNGSEVNIDDLTLIYTDVVSNNYDEISGVIKGDHSLDDFIRTIPLLAGEGIIVDYKVVATNALFTHAMDTDDDNEDAIDFKLVHRMLNYVTATEFIYDIYDTSELPIDGSKFGKAIGVKFDNIILPKDILCKLQGLRFYYKERGLGEARVLGEMPLINFNIDNEKPDDDTNHIIDFNIKSHNFDLFNNTRKHINIDYYKILSNEDITDYRLCNLDNLRVEGGGDNTGLIRENRFLLQGNLATKPSNEDNEENIYINIKNKRVDFKTGNLAFMFVYKTNMYAPFYSSEINALNTPILFKDNIVDYGINLIKVVNTPIHYGGDTFIVCEGVRITYGDSDNGTEPDNVKNTALMYPTHRLANVGLRSGNDTTKLYINRNNIDSFNNLAETLGYDNVALLYNIYDYFLAYSSTNNLKVPIVNNPLLIYNDFNKFRIHRSPIQHEDVAAIQLRDFRPLSFYDIDKDKGGIVSLDRFNRKLIIHTKYTTYIAKIKDVLKPDEADSTYLGKGDLFDREPVELLDNDNGQYGNTHPIANITTPSVHLFIDSSRNAIYMLTDNKVQNLVTNGNTNMFIDVFKNNVFVVSGYDSLNNRVFFTFHNVVANGNTYNPLVTYPTASFDLSKFVLSSFHTTKPTAYISGRNNLLPVVQDFIATNEMFNFINHVFYYKANSNTHGRYELVHTSDNPVDLSDMTIDVKPFSIDVIFNDIKNLNELLENIIFLTKFESNGSYIYNKTITSIQLYNNTQCSEEIPINNNITWFDVTTGREEDGVWVFNDFRDAVLNNLLPFFDNAGDTINTNVNQDAKDWFDNGNFTGQFIVVRLIFNNESNDDITIKDVIVNKRVNSL